MLVIESNVFEVAIILYDYSVVTTCSKFAFMIRKKKTLVVCEDDFVTPWPILKTKIVTYDLEAKIIRVQLIQKTLKVD